MKLSPQVKSTSLGNADQVGTLRALLLGKCYAGLNQNGISHYTHNGPRVPPGHNSVHLLHRIEWCRGWSRCVSRSTPGLGSTQVLRYRVREVRSIWTTTLRGILRTADAIINIPAWETSSAHGGSTSLTWAWCPPNIRCSPCRRGAVPVRLACWRPGGLCTTLA